MDIVLSLIVGVCVYVLLGVGLTFHLIDRISTYEVYVTEVFSHPFKLLAMWPHTLWFFTRKDIVKTIKESRHMRYPWCFDLEGNKYPKDVADKLLKEQVNAEFEAKRQETLQ